MRRIGFSKALRRVPSETTDALSQDASRGYASLCDRYKWTLPHIRNELTEPQVFGMMQHIRRMEERQITNAVVLFVNYFIKYVIDPLFGQKNK